MEPPLISCGTIGSHNILRNDLFRVFQVDEWTIKLSLKEYLIMLHLISGEPVTEDLLIEAAYGSEQTSTHEEPLSKHLERLRKKLRPCGLVIRRITQHGYLLVNGEEGTVAS